MLLLRSFPTIFVFISAFVLTDAFAVQVKISDRDVVPCGVVKAFAGEVQVLDPTQTHLIDVAVGTGIPCGGWVTTQKGWVSLEHRQGYEVKLARDGFIEVFDFIKDEYQTGSDHIVFYRGKVYVSVPPGTHAFSLSTSNAKAKLDRGVMVAIFDHSHDETQIISLSGKPELMNRFSQDKKVEVSPGELSSISLSTLRVIPESPQAINLASLKKALDRIPLTAEQYQIALRIVENRANRKLASEPSGYSSSRAVASVEGQAEFHYSRQSDQADDSQARAVWLKRMGGGALLPENILFPGQRVSEKESTESASRSPAGATQREAQREELRQIQTHRSERIQIERQRVMKAVGDIQYE
jgi:hypothetical protein